MLFVAQYGFFFLRFRRRNFIFVAQCMRFYKILATKTKFDEWNLYLQFDDEIHPCTSHDQPTTDLIPYTIHRQVQHLSLTQTITRNN